MGWLEKLVDTKERRGRLVGGSEMTQALQGYNGLVDSREGVGDDSSNERGVR